MRTLASERVHWLPSDDLDRPGRATPITVDELSEIEVDDLREAAPQIAALLADSHPARDVARNLFRLSRLLRLAAQPGGPYTPRTEIDMAEQWWETADGQRDDLHRDRSRILRLLAERALLEPRDPATLVGAVITLVAVSALAGWLPAYRASRIDPAEVLRER